MVMTLVVSGTSLSKQLSDWQAASMRMVEHRMPESIAVICQNNARLVDYVVVRQFMLNLRTVNVIRKHK